MKRSLLLFFFAVASLLANSQCGTGSTTCSVNWDYLDFFSSAGNAPYTDLARSQTQRFAFGKQYLTLTHNFTGSNASGESAVHTAAAGEDLLFSMNGAITVTFQSGVQNVAFSLYDIDVDQTITVTSPGNAVTLTRAGTTVLGTPTGNGTSTAVAVATSSAADVTTHAGTLTVQIVGASITSFTITATTTGTRTNGPASGRENGDWWLSDISGCSAAAFNLTYFDVARPYTNQAGYVLTVADNSVYYVDPATGRSKFLFTDAAASYLNSLAYDPVKKYVYYVLDATASGGGANANNKSVKRYNYNTDTLGTAIVDVTAFLPTFDAGVEIGGAAFYDGSLYLGVDVGGSTGFESILWRIDFDAMDRPIAASQVFAVDGANHDWGDLGVANGMLYDFDGKTTDPNYFHQDLYTKNVTVYVPTGSNTPKQTAIDWNSRLYSLGNSTATVPSTGVVIPYNNDGTVNTAAQQTITFNNVQLSARWGDAGEAFKPRVDFGDAPSTFDPTSGEPAMHELNSLLRLGAGSSDEWVTRGQTALANSDNLDDGITMGSLVNPSAGTFYAEIKYFNNTGNTATLCAWVDFNNNNMFDAGEGKILTNIASTGVVETVYLYWNGITTSLTNGQYTYLRVRIAPSTSGMGIANATGFFGDGEVEDYRLVVSTFPLDTKLLRFDAVRQADGKAAVSWSVSQEENGTIYTVQRSDDARRWQTVDVRTVNGAGTNHHRFVDPSSANATMYYRLQMQTSKGPTWSDVRKVSASGDSRLLLTPNPASNAVSFTVNAVAAGKVSVQLVDASGRMALWKQVTVTPGSNALTLDLTPVSKGVYWLRVQDGGQVSNEKLVVNK